MNPKSDLFQSCCGLSSWKMISNKLVPDSSGISWISIAQNIELDVLDISSPIYSEVKTLMETLEAMSPDSEGAMAFAGDLGKSHLGWTAADKIARFF